MSHSAVWTRISWKLFHLDTCKQDLQFNRDLHKKLSCQTGWSIHEIKRCLGGQRCSGEREWRGQAWHDKSWGDLYNAMNNEHIQRRFLLTDTEMHTPYINTYKNISTWQTHILNVLHQLHHLIRSPSEMDIKLHWLPLSTKQERTIMTPTSLSTTVLLTQIFCFCKLHKPSKSEVYFLQGYFNLSNILREDKFSGLKISCIQSMLWTLWYLK